MKIILMAEFPNPNTSLAEVVAQPKTSKQA
jgi:hypothetical protein